MRLYPENDADQICPATGKVMHFTAEAAERRAKRIRQYGHGVRSDTAHAYLCEECGGFHVGRYLNPAADKNFEEPA